MACFLLSGLAACGNDSDPGPDSVTAGEARALGDAAEMLDEQRLKTPVPTPSTSPESAPPGTEATPTG